MATRDQTSDTGVSPVDEQERGTGVSPVKAEEHGKDARATLAADHGRDAHATALIHKRHGAYLPHWTRDGAIYAVMFRLADSLPSHVLKAWLGERRNIVVTAQQMGRPLSEHEEERLRQLHSERVEAHLDAGHGACWLRQSPIAQIVADALRYLLNNPVSAGLQDWPWVWCAKAVRGTGVPPVKAAAHGRDAHAMGEKSSGETPEPRLLRLHGTLAT